MHEREIPFAHDRLRVFVRAVVVVAVQHDFPAERADRVHLDVRCRQRHHDDRRNSASFRRERHALRVIAGRRADHATPGDRFREVRDLVVGAAQLERKHRLQVFALEQHFVADAAREARRGIERRFHRDVIDAGLEDALDVVVGHR
jgi:hypothetical protein